MSSSYTQNWIQSSSSWDSPLFVQGKLNGMIPILYKTGIIHTNVSSAVETRFEAKVD